MSSTRPGQLDRYTRIADLGTVVRNLLTSGTGVLVGLLVIGISILLFNDNPGWACLLWMSVGTLAAFLIWRSKGVGLPLVPVVALQHLIAYGAPVLSSNDTIQAYPAEFLTRAGIEGCIFLITMAVAWRAGMEFAAPGRTRAFVLKVFDTDNIRPRIRIALLLVLGTTAYNILQSMQVIDVMLRALPAGMSSLISPVIKSTTMAGYFLLAMMVGARDGGRLVRFVFWSTLAINAVLIASSFLLSAATNLMAAAVIGLFWGSGRLPWRFITITLVALSFLHFGKFEMRERYWGTDELDRQVVSFAKLPDIYSEWFEASLRSFEKTDTPSAQFGRFKKAPPSMLDRVDNLQNLLFAINAVDERAIPTLDGATYRLIPPLLIPRVLWPDKPRAHEGQVMLNVHFERQTLEATFKTYIAWGLLAEAYGNFGRFWGALILGGTLGLLFAWIENKTANKPLLSLEGLVSFAVFTGIAVSFEMSASVLVTSLFQTIVIITMACAPFVHRTSLNRPEPDAKPVA